MTENTQEKTYNTNDIYIGDVIKVEEFLYVRMDLNNGRPWVDGSVLRDRKHNLFIKKGDNYIRITSGKEYKVMQHPCEIDAIGIQPNSLMPLKERLKLGFKERGIDSLDLTMKDVIELQSELSSLYSEHEADLATRFHNFMDYYENEKEKI